jgi:hypothetical protein
MGLSFGIVETVDLEPTVSLVLGAVASLVFLGFGLVLEPALRDAARQCIKWMLARILRRGAS